MPPVFFSIASFAAAFRAAFSSGVYSLLAFASVQSAATATKTANEGLLTEAEYAAQRAKIISAL